MDIQESHCFNDEKEPIQMAAAFCHLLCIFLPEMWMGYTKMELLSSVDTRKWNSYLVTRRNTKTTGWKSRVGK